MSDETLIGRCAFSSDGRRSRATVTLELLPFAADAPAYKGRPTWTTSGWVTGWMPWGEPGPALRSPYLLSAKVSGRATLELEIGNAVLRLSTDADGEAERLGAELAKAREALATAKRRALTLIDSEADGMHPDYGPPLVRALCEALGITDEEVRRYRFGDAADARRREEGGR